MINLLPIKVLHDIDMPIFGSLNVALARLSRDDLPVAEGVIITPPDIKILSTLFYLDFGQKELFSQNLEIVKKQFQTLPLPELLVSETKGRKQFFLKGKVVQTTAALWKELLTIWLSEIEQSLWMNGFNTNPEKWMSVQVVSFVNNVQAIGTAIFNQEIHDSQIKIEFGNLHPKYIKLIDELIQKANKKLFIPHEYQWVLDTEVKIVGIKPYTPILKDDVAHNPQAVKQDRIKIFRQSATKVYYNYVNESAVLQELDGIYIAAEKMININQLKDSVEELILKIAQMADKFPDTPILLKLPDLHEQRYGIRGSIRLINQASLLTGIADALLFLRNKKGFKNIYITIPYVRNSEEFNQMKRELSARKLIRTHSLQMWLEISVPENLINLREYLVSGLDGVVINIDDLSACLGGYDQSIDEMSLYRKQTKMVIKFLADNLSLLYENKVKILVIGELTFYPEVLEFLIATGVFGIIAPKYEMFSLKDLLYSVEEKLIKKRS